MDAKKLLYDDVMTKEWTLNPGEEFRFEVGFKNSIEVKLKSGHAEYFGAELGPEATYTFSGQNGAIFTWQGCTLSVTGDCQSIYVAGETPMDSYINVHMALQQLRVQAHSEMQSSAAKGTSAAPRVMIVGPEDSGKTSLARILINYAVRMGDRPIFVDLDPAEASVTVPGTISATAIAKTIDIETGFMGYSTSSSVGGPSDSPLVLQFGHELPSKNAVLFKLLVDRLTQAIAARFEADTFAAASGLIVDTRGFTDINKFDIIESAIASLGINTLLVVGNERMYSLFSSRFSKADGSSGSVPVNVVKLAKSGGTVDRDAMYRQQLSAHRIRQYFYGTPSEPVMSFSTVVNFQEISILRVGEDVQAPSSTLPLGETRKLSETSVFAVEPDESLTHSVLAVTEVNIGNGEEDGSDQKAIEEARKGVVGVQAVGFINVTKVDMEKKRFIAYSPVPGRLPKQVLLYGHIKWMETL
ncbi:Cleavage polyadenylation factor subunit clp1 [Coemansia sp. Benny D115]|nr:Cleavage polyadenylation factor subunit clp1 [Coemansia sp. Benny D115]